MALSAGRSFSLPQAACSRPFHARLDPEMSLAEASDARKARLLALRKRKAGETVDGARCVLWR